MMKDNKHKVIKLIFYVFKAKESEPQCYATPPAQVTVQNIEGRK